MKTATILVGLPCSGKTTYIKKNNLTSISRDEIVEGLCSGMTYSEAFKAVDQKLVDVIYNDRLYNLIDSGIDFCVDKTNLTFKGRYNTIKRLKSNGYKVKLIIFDVDLDIIKKRNIQRNLEIGKFIPEYVLDKMQGYFDFPSMSEGKLIYYDNL